MLSIIALSFGVSVGSSGATDPFGTIWKSSWRNITVPRELSVKGTIPAWVSGSLIRNAPGAYETEHRNVTYAFDGFPKIYKFTVSNGKVTFQERFLETGYFTYAQKNNDLPKLPSFMGPTNPPFSPLALPGPSDAGDNDNVQVWRLKGDDRVLALTDSAVMQSFDFDSLDTLGPVPVSGEKVGLIELSCAHPMYDPASDGKVLVNFASSLVGFGALSGHHEISVFRLGVDKVRHYFGSVVVAYAPYIHSFTVTQTKMVLVVYPLDFKISCVLAFKPLINCMECPADRNATVFVFDLNSSEKSKPPIATLTTANHMVMHHVNGYDDSKTGDVVFDVSAHDDCDGLFHGPTGQHANLAVMRDPTARDKVSPWGNFRSFRISFGTAGASIQYSDRPLRDADGHVYKFDFPYVNPNVASRYNRYVWAVTSYAKNSTHYGDWAVIKIDREASDVNTKVWFKQGHITGEPAFVSRPGATAEDDGVLLVATVDGWQSRAYLLILDAATMEEIATSSLDAGEHMPYNQHGRWFESTLSEAMVV